MNLSHFARALSRKGSLSSHHSRPHSAFLIGDRCLLLTAAEPPRHGSTFVPRTRLSLQAASTQETKLCAEFNRCLGSANKRMNQPTTHPPGKTTGYLSEWLMGL